jgi:hypothetical protein
VLTFFISSRYGDVSFTILSKQASPGVQKSFNNPQELSDEKLNQYAEAHCSVF